MASEEPPDRRVSPTRGKGNQEGDCEKEVSTGSIGGQGKQIESKVDKDALWSKGGSGKEGFEEV